MFGNSQLQQIGSETNAPRSLFKLGQQLDDAADALRQSTATLTDGDLSRRLVGLTSEDWLSWETVRHDIVHDGAEIIQNVCQRVTTLDNTLGSSPQSLTTERLKDHLQEYLDSISSFENGAGLLVDCATRGRAYQDQGISLQWYLSIEHILFGVIRDLIKRRYADQACRLPSLLSALERVLKLDETLVVEAYYTTGIGGLRSHLRQAVTYQNELWKTAIQDALTRVSTRAFLIESMEKELLRCRRFNHSLSVLMIDFDQFKEINDTHGHLAGDFVLRYTCTLLRAWLRPCDLIGRYGGDEFVIALVESDAAAAKSIAERVRASVAEGSCRYARQAIPVTISIGLACLKPDVDCVNDLLQMADLALFEAKRAGRNSIRVFASNRSLSPEDRLLVTENH